MHYDDKEWVEEALDVIRRTDPGTWKRMQESRWTVHVVTDVRNDPAAWRELGWAALTFAEADGVTSIHHPFSTMINKQQIIRDAADFKVPAVDVAADTLVHEFVHYHDQGEVPAFREGIRFARELGEASLVNINEKMLAAVRKGDYPSS